MAEESGPYSSLWIAMLLMEADDAAIEADTTPPSRSELGSP
jgi:hypothetical protein